MISILPCSQMKQMALRKKLRRRSSGESQRVSDVRGTPHFPGLNTFNRVNRLEIRVNPPRAQHFESQ